MIKLEDLKPETWFGGRDGGMDICDEWQPSNSWRFERVLMRGVETQKYWDHPAPRVMLKLHIWGKSSKGKCRAVSWTAEITYGQNTFRTDRLKGRCTSCKDAKRQVMENPDLCRSVTQILRRAYGPRGAECVYRQRDGQWEPWLTMLGIDWSEACWSWPVGDYEVRAWNDHWKAEPGEVRAFRRRRSQCGISSGGIGERPDLECWLPELPSL